MSRFVRRVGLALGIGALGAGGVEGYRRVGSEVEQTASALANSVQNVELAPRDPNAPAAVIKDSETGETAPLGKRGEKPSDHFTPEQEQALIEHFAESKGLSKKYECSMRQRGVAILLKDRRVPSTVAFLRPSLSGKYVITDALGRQTQLLPDITKITADLLDSLDKPTYKGYGEPEPEAEVPTQEQTLPRLPDSVQPEAETPIEDFDAADKKSDVAPSAKKQDNVDSADLL